MIGKEKIISIGIKTSKILVVGNSSSLFSFFQFLTFLASIILIRRSEFPSPANSNSWGAKGIPVKGVSGVASSHQKPLSSKHAEHALSPPPSTGQPFSKGKKDASKHSGIAIMRSGCVFHS